MRAADKKLLPTSGRPLARSYRRSGYVDAVDSRHVRIKYRGRLLYLRSSLTRRGENTPYLILRRGRLRKIECLFTAIIHRSYREPGISCSADTMETAVCVVTRQRVDRVKCLRSSALVAPCDRRVPNLSPRVLWRGQIGGRAASKGGSCNKTDALNVSLTVSGECRCRAYICEWEKGRYRNLAVVISSIAESGRRGQRCFSW